MTQAAALRVRLLICEDSEDDALLIARRLHRDGIEVDYERVERAAETAEALRLRPPELVISDYHMPGFGAADALELLRASGLDVPFILVSGRIGEESAVELMRAGAHDFVLKDRMTRLAAVVRRELRAAEYRRERRAAEEALRLSEQRLRQAERLESLGRLAGGIAHDFNNLLAVILGHTDLALADLPADSPHRPGMELIHTLAGRGADLTRQLLVFSRQQPLHPETLDANAVVADTERVLRGAIEEDVEFVTRLAPDLGQVVIDRGELERLLLNLVVNSRRAMPYGGRLVIETANVPSPGADAGGAGDLVRLCVRDTGVGMSDEVRKHAFEPFFTTDSDGGTGLGLSSAYGVVKAAGGEIRLQSRPGAGTTVTIDLPAVRREAEKTHVPEPAAPGGEGRTLLVVEDDEAVRDLVSTMVRRNGYRAIAVASPADALTVFEESGRHIDALLTDMVMPGMSGIELAEAARSGVPGLPVLVMSGYAAGAMPGQAAMPDDVSLIRKPFTTAALMRALSDILAPADMV